MTASSDNTLSDSKKALLARLRRGGEGSDLSKATEIPRLAKSQAVLSFAQLRLWFLDQLQPGNAAYNIPLAMRLKGVLNTEALQRAVDDLVARHEPLRTTFTIVDNEPRQVIAEHASAKITFDQSADGGVLRETLTRLAFAPFDLQTGPLFRVSLIKLSEQEHVLLIVMHHIVSDGWSLSVLFGELSKLYDQHLSGSPPSLATSRIQYSDYAEWQRQRLSGDDLGKHVKYWQEHLAGAPAVLELPTDRPRPPVQTYRGAEHGRFIPFSSVQKFDSIRREQGSTLYMVLLGVFAVLMSHWTRQKDIVVGTPISGRPKSELESLVGLFVNTLPVRVDLGGDPTFRELLRRINESAMQGFLHQDLPFEKLVEELNPERDPSYAPIVQVLFNVVNIPPGSLQLTGLEVSAESFTVETAQMDLSVHIYEMPEGLYASFQYNADLFDLTTIERLAGHFGKLLENLADRIDEPASSVSFLTEAERKQVLIDWNRTDVDYDQSMTLQSEFEAQVSRDGTRIALEFGPHRLTYAELNGRVNQLARHLRFLGVQRGSLVGVFLERSIEMVVSLYAIQKAGGAYVPLDPGYPLNRLADILEDAKADIVLTSTPLSDTVVGLGARPVCLDQIASELAELDDTNPELVAAPRDLAYVIFTSGSTGRPKGVMNEHRGICNRLLWMQGEYGLDHTDVVLQKTPFSFDVSVWEFFWPLLAGAKLVIAAPGAHRDGRQIADLIDHHKVTTIHFVPSMLNAFLETLSDSGSLNSLKRIFCSGEALSGKLAYECQQRIPAGLHNLYGPTEAAVDVTYWQCSPEDGEASVPIGRPVANTRLYLLDGNLNPVPIGVPGELHIGGVQVARGYVNRPDLTEERFIPDPFSSVPGATMYKTGDLVRYRADGAIEFLGRLDHQIKLRGFRIELGEIETVLRDTPAVSEAVVVARASAGNDLQLVAYVLATGDSKPTIDSLRADLHSKLPEYMVPNAFVVLDEFPLNANGKIDRKKLPEPERQHRSSTSFVAPESEFEQLVASVWEQVLGVERVGLNDNFFEQGGHSLSLVQVETEIRSRTGRSVPLIEFFRRPTVSSLAKYLGAKDEKGSSLDAVRTRVAKQRVAFRNPRLDRSRP